MYSVELSTFKINKKCPQKCKCKKSFLLDKQILLNLHQHCVLACWRVSTPGPSPYVSPSLLATGSINSARFVLTPRGYPIVACLHVYVCKKVNGVRCKSSKSLKNEKGKEDCQKCEKCKNIKGQNKLMMLKRCKDQKDRKKGDIYTLMTTQALMWRLC